MSDGLQVVEASYGWCPDRTLWTLGDDGYWHCHCCRVSKATLDQLRGVKWLSGQAQR